MTWIHRYRLRRYLRSSVWMAPFVGMVTGFLFHHIIWALDKATGWTWLGLSQEGARAIVGVIASAMLTFMVFTFSSLLLVVQIASAQLTPRIIALALEDRILNRALGAFVFTFIYAVGVLGRVGDVVWQLHVLMAIVACVVSIVVFLQLVDHMGKSLRPVSVVQKVAAQALEIIASIYPQPLSDSGPAPVDQARLRTRPPARTIHHRDSSGVLLALYGPGLVESARRNQCLIRLAPQVGDFVTQGEPLFNIYDGGAGLDEDELLACVAFGPERTVQQDPAFALRIIVDIALRALSPAINDPTTAVVALDQIHRLLRSAGQRDLGDGTLRDAAGAVRFMFPTPNWEDFVRLAMSEIRLCGAGNIQVVRRLRAMIENLLAILPAARHPCLVEQLDLLDHTVKRSFADPRDRAYAGMSDYQGVGSPRGDHVTGGSAGQEGTVARPPPPPSSGEL